MFQGRPELIFNKIKRVLLLCLPLNGSNILSFFSSLFVLQKNLIMSSLDKGGPFFPRELLPQVHEILVSTFKTYVSSTTNRHSTFKVPSLSSMVLILTQRNKKQNTHMHSNTPFCFHYVSLNKKL